MKCSRSNLSAAIISIFHVVRAQLRLVEQNDLLSFDRKKERKTISGRRATTCPYICTDGLNCDMDICANCEFNCIGNTDQCTFWDDMELRAAISSRQISTRNGVTRNSCKIATFVDVTKNKFPQTDNDNYWYEWNHSGLPYHHQGAPLFVDLNNDGVLDYFNSMHGFYMENGYEGRMELAESVAYDFPRDNIIPAVEFSDPDIRRLRQTSYRIIIDDEIVAPMDPHGQNVLDLDNDGILDIFISSGGARGKNLSEEQHMARDNFLFWGEEGIDEVTGERTTIFRGGRDAARKAGVHMRYGRGRLGYMLDVNSDGFIDIFCLQDRRVSNEIAPGILLINQGDRTWREEASMSEYTRAMILTDADGDGLAQELMLHRGYCFPQRSGPEIDQNLPDYGPYPDDVLKFCSTRPVGTTAVYRYNPSSMRMEDISSVKYRNISPSNNKQPPCCPNGSWSNSQDCNAEAFASGDFDNDQLADHIILFQTKMIFYFSSDRTAGELPIGRDYVGAELHFPQHCTDAESLRLIDFNNDGVEEILVMCKKAATFLIYTKGKGKTDWTLDNGCNSEAGSLGDLTDVSMVELTKQNYEDWCTTGSAAATSKLEEFCESYKDPKKKSNFFTAGISTVDLNNDGFLDVVATYNFGYLRFFHNSPSYYNKLNQFISFQIIGIGYGLGASVILHEVRDGKPRTQFREISSYQHTSDVYGHMDHRLIFGLGRNGKPMKVIVRWSDGHKQVRWLSKWSFGGRGKMDVIEIRKNGPCTDHPWKVFNLWGQKRSCRWLNSINDRNRMKYCQKSFSNAAQKCPSACAGLCMCEDNPAKHVTLNGVRKTCRSLWTLSIKDIRNTCERNMMARTHCPESCEGWCI